MLNSISDLSNTDQNGQPNKIERNEMQNINLQHISRLNTPITINPEESSFDDVSIHATIRQRLSPGTIQRNLRYARFMENHPQPVDFKNPSYENFIRHMDYREQIEGSQWGALKHQWQAMRMFLKAWGIDPQTWPYKPPSRPTYTIRPIPFPEAVYKIIHHDYSKDEYTNALIKYLLCHNYVIGWRFPSEPQTVKLSDLDIDNSTLIITEPKKHHSTRYIDIEEICKKRNIHSMKNWLTWRNKVENQHSNDYLYLKPNGKPFKNPDQLRQFINRLAGKQIKTIYPKYYNYNTRHWCAVARLIRSKLFTKKFDEYEVKEWLGHTKIQTTMGYIKEAKFYHNKAPYDWIKRVLKRNYRKRPVAEQNSLTLSATGTIEKSTNPENTLVLRGISPREGYAVDRYRRTFLLLEKSLFFLQQVVAI